MADKSQVTAFISARDKQDKKKTIEELMKEFNFTESTAVTYYSQWEKNYMKGGDKVDMAQKISKETFEMAKNDGDRTQLLEKIEELKKANTGLKNHLSMCIGENEKFKVENESLSKQLAEQDNRGKLLEEIEALQKENLEIRNNSLTHMADISNVKEVNDILRAQSESLTKENQGLNDVIYESKEIIESLKLENVKFNNHIEILNDENVELLKCISNMERKGSVQSEVPALESVIDRLKCDIQQRDSVICKMTMEKYCNEVR